MQRAGLRVRAVSKMIGVNQIYQGDCIEVMKTWPANVVDTIITDPPYGLDFMGKDWDGDVPGVHFWEEMLRVCKPGALLLSFGGTRTWHHLATAIEKAGWEIRDCVMWLYGSGFPKSLDISKAIDKAKGAERPIIGQHKQSIPQISPRENFGQRFGDEGKPNEDGDMTDRSKLCDCEAWTEYLGVHNLGMCEALNEKEKRECNKRKSSEPNGRNLGNAPMNSSSKRER